MPAILVAEDDADIAGLVRHYLEKDGFAVAVLDSGRDVVSRMRAAPADLLVLDLMLPGVDGLTICRALRADPATAAIPIIMLTARASESDRIAGLELGADDYLTKPFSPKELVLRVRALLRRVERSPSTSTVTS
jgi:DNA-binding response OmpR family regulator